MKGIIIGIENIDKKKKDGSPYQGIKMRWGYKKADIVGLDVRTDWISRDKIIFNEFNPFLNSLDKLIDKKIDIDLMPTGFVNNGVPVMEIVDFHISEK